MVSNQKYKFKEKLYKIGINWCVDVPKEISLNLDNVKGKIYIKGKINEFNFTKTLMPIGNGKYRLFVNQNMIKGGNVRFDDFINFEISQDYKILKEYPVPKQLENRIIEENLTVEFNTITPAKKQSILKYLNNIKTENTLQININKLIIQLKNNEKNVRIP